MENNSLTVSGGSTNTTGQASTQSPQQSTSANFSGARSSSVQPGTTASTLVSSQGVQLEPQALTTVNVGSSTASKTTNAGSNPAPDSNKLNPFLLAITLVFIVVAVVMFWAIQRSVKSTTKY